MRAGVTKENFFPLIEMVAPSGALLRYSVLPGARNTTGGSSNGLEPISTSRCSISYPGFVTAMVWRPGGASKRQGVTQLTSICPSKVAVAPAGLLFVALYGLLRGWAHCLPFGVWMYSCMMIDHQLHKLFHKAAHLPGPLGRLQRMHLIHHEPHRLNYFYVSGLVGDLLFRTAQTKKVLSQPDPVAAAQTALRAVDEQWSRKK